MRRLAVSAPSGLAFGMWTVRSSPAPQKRVRSRRPRSPDAEKRRSLGRRLLDAAGVRFVSEEHLDLPLHEATTGPGRHGIRSLIREAIEEAAEDGDAVIVAHAASHALAGREGVLRVLVTGSYGVRAERVARESAVDLDSARREVADSDRGRAAYLSEFYGVEDEQPNQYDLVVNTDVLTPVQAAQIIVVAARL